MLQRTNLSLTESLMKSIVILSCILLFAQCFPADDSKLLYTAFNPDGSFSISVYYREAFGFGPHPIKIYAEREDEARTLLVRDIISNDGYGIGESNVSIKWLSNGAELYLNGDEQEQKTIRVSREGRRDYSVQEVE